MKFLFVSIFAFLPASIFAQSSPIPQELKIVVENLDDTSRQCGISESIIRGAIASAMRYNRITEKDEIFTPWVYVVATTIKTSSSCFTSWDISVQRSHFQKLDDGRYISGKFVYCDKGGILTGGQQSTRLPATLKVGFDSCLADIDAVEIDI